MQDILGQRYYHFQGFEVSRKIVMEGEITELPDMLHELGDILAELSIQSNDKVQGNIIVNNLTAGRIKLSMILVSSPKK